MEIRIEEAIRERDGSHEVCQISNGDIEDDGSPILMAKFHKTLPHDSLGQVKQIQLLSGIHLEHLVGSIDCCAR